MICRRSVKSVERRYATSKGVFEFNHIDPAQKSRIYEKLIRRVVSTEQLDELDKCNLLCRICHGVWTNQRLRGTQNMKFTLPDGRKVEHSVAFHGLLEFRGGTPTIYAFSDAPALIDTYAISLGGKRRVFRLGFELRRQLGKLVLATRRLGTLHIWDRRGIVFTATRLDEQSVRLEFSVRFPFFRLELESDDPKQGRIWARNGKIVSRTSGVRRGGAFGVTVEYRSW